MILSTGEEMEIMPKENVCEEKEEPYLPTSGYTEDGQWFRTDGYDPDLVWKGMEREMQFLEHPYNSIQPSTFLENPHNRRHSSEILKYQKN